MAIELEVQQADVVINTPIEIEVDNRLAAVTDVTNDLQVEINRKEYSIVGDELYIPSRYEDAPTWLQDIINQVVAVSIATEKGDLNQATESLNQLIAELEVAKNTYTQSIISSNDIDERINTAITTLNSTLAEADATILSIAQTKTTPEEAAALVIDGINAQLDTQTGSIGAVIGALQQAVVDGDSANATSIDTLASTITGEVDARATAVNTLNTYVGITSTGTVTGTGILADVSILQKQNDGVIETYTGTYDVMIGIEDPNTDITNDELDATQEPYATWIATDTANGNEEQRAMHVGDVYIKYTSSDEGYKTYDRAYKFIKTEVDTTSPYSTDTDGYTWALIVDTDAQNAYVAALNAYDLADDKRRVFTATPTAPYDDGDLWVDDLGTYSVIKKYVASTDVWVVADEQISEFADTIYTPAITALQDQIDGKIEYWFNDSTDDPKDGWTVDERANRDGDVWYQVDTKESYYYTSDSNSWNAITDKDAIQALEDAAEAKEAADNVIVSYYAWDQTLAPDTKYKWFKDDNTLWEHNGTTWVAVDAKKDDTLTAYNNTTKDTTLYVYNSGTWGMVTPDGIVANSKAVTDLSTELNNGTNTWASADSTLENTLSTKIDNDTAEVESKFAYNSIIGINGNYYTSGFGLNALATSGSGTEVDPYNSEFWINAEKFKFTNSNATGQVAPFTIDASGSQPKITFNGLVTFGSGQTGTIDEAITAVVETVSIGDKNINITDNLIPTTSLVVDTDNSGYQFIDSPTKSYEAGIDTFAEAQVTLNAADEVYSPYVDEVGVAYYYRFGIKGVTDLSTFGIVTIDGSDVATFNNVTYAGDALVSTNWYVVEGIINPYGGSTSASGSVRDANGSKIGEINNFALPSGTSKVVLGWVANCAISRMKLAKITAETVVGSTASVDYVDNSIAALPAPSWDELTDKDTFAQKLGYADYTSLETAASAGNTIINGGYFNTDIVDAGAITANLIDAYAISGKTISGGTITGTNLYGTYIEGAVIKASYIDLTSTATLTNWQQYTPANYPSAYDANFAKNNDGTLLVDSQGYVRLMGNTNIITAAQYHNQHGAYNATYTANPFELDLHPYNSYTTSSINRCILENSNVHFEGFVPEQYNNLMTAGMFANFFGSTSTLDFRFYMLGDYIEIYIAMTPSGSGYINGIKYLKVNGVTITTSSDVYSSYTYTKTVAGLTYRVELKTLRSFESAFTLDIYGADSVLSVFPGSNGLIKLETGVVDVNGVNGYANSTLSISIPTISVV